MSSLLDETTIKSTSAGLAGACRVTLERHGFVLVPGFLGDAELAAGQHCFARHVPTPDEFFASGPHKYGQLRSGPFGGQIWFPIGDDVLDDQLTSPRLVALLQEITGISEIRLSPGAQLFAKYAGATDYEQELHFDGTPLAVPGRAHCLKRISAFLYYSDVTERCGPTYAVPKQNVPEPSFDGAVWRPNGVCSFPRDRYQELYAHEVPLTAAPGSLLLFTPDTIHRGSALGAPPAHRWVSVASFHEAGVDWMSTYNFDDPDSARMRRLNDFIVRATPAQRSLLGFPSPDDRYWRDDRVRAGVAARYPGIDLRPYQA